MKGGPAKRLLLGASRVFALTERRCMQIGQSGPQQSHRGLHLRHEIKLALRMEYTRYPQGGSDRKCALRLSADSMRRRLFQAKLWAFDLMGVSTHAMPRHALIPRGSYAGITLEGRRFLMMMWGLSGVMVLGKGQTEPPVTLSLAKASAGFGKGAEADDKIDGHRFSL